MARSRTVPFGTLDLRLETMDALEDAAKKTGDPIAVIIATVLDLAIGDGLLAGYVDALTYSKGRSE